MARALKAWGILVDGGPASRGDGEPMPLPRIRVKRTRKDHSHALGRSEIRRALQFFGESCTYGLREIELSSKPGLEGHRLNLGKLVVPGRIIIYAQPRSPWHLPGRVGGRVLLQLKRAGAVVELAGSGAQTIITWPANTLRDFLLFDVLMHEIGHHLIQQYRGKRGVRVARTRDHEAFAGRFARRCRSLYGG